MACSKCCCRATDKVTQIQPFRETDREIQEFHGPLEQRECRDLFFLLIFVLFLLGIGGVTVVAVLRGNPYRLQYGVDSFGNVCNQKNEVIEGVNYSGIDNTGKSNVFFFKEDYFIALLRQQASPSVVKDATVIICVDKCPNQTLQEADFSKPENLRLCLYNTTAFEASKCPRLPVNPQRNVFNRCVPEWIFTQAETLAASFASVLSNGIMGENFPLKIVSDLKNTWRVIGYLTALGLGVALVVVILMGIFAAVIVYTLVIAVMFCTMAASTYCWYTWAENKQVFDELPPSEQTDEAKHTVITWIVYACIASAFSVVLFLILLVLRKRIALVVQLFKEAGKAIRKLPCLLILPFVTLIFIVAFVGALGLVAAFIETSGLPEVNPTTKHVKYVQEPFWNYLRWYNIFSMLWISSFLAACQDFVTAGAVATWYFSWDKKNLGCPIAKSILRLIRYHIGSIAFGSFIIAVVKLARIVLAYIQHKLKDKAGQVAQFIMKCLQCCLWCFEKFLQYLNRNAYIEIAIYGYSFCKAGQKAVMLITANVLRVAAINSVGDLVLTVGKISTAAIVVVVGHEILKGRDDINYIWVPLTVAGVFAFAIAHCFLLIYEIAIDTIFLCFCEDCERNDGHLRPYFMSKNLMVYIDNENKAAFHTPPRRTVQTTKM